MVQREVADRIVASPGTRAYGVLSATTQMYARAEQLFTLPPGAFSPPPEVHSTVFRLTMRPRFQELGVDPKGFLNLVRQVFAQKRKTLANNLRAAGYEAARIRSALAECAIGPSDPGRGCLPRKHGVPFPCPSRQSMIRVAKRTSRRVMKTRRLFERCFKSGLFQRRPWPPPPAEPNSVAPVGSNSVVPVGPSSAARALHAENTPTACLLDFGKSGAGWEHPARAVRLARLQHRLHADRASGRDSPTLRARRAMFLLIPRMPPSRSWCVPKEQPRVHLC